MFLYYPSVMLLSIAYGPSLFGPDCLLPQSNTVFIKEIMLLDKNVVILVLQYLKLEHSKNG